MTTSEDSVDDLVDGGGGGNGGAGIDSVAAGV